MDKEQFLIKSQDIKGKYQKSHNILFKYWVFLLIAIFSTIKIYSIFSNKSIEIYDKNSLESQKETKINEFTKKLQQKNNQGSFTWPLMLWQIQETNEYIESFNNLVYYKGFVVPRFFWVSKIAQIKDINYFKDGNYSLEELDILFKNIFIWSNKNINKPQKNISFPLSKWIIEDFNLQCLFQKKINNFICNIFVEKFLNEFFIYNIETDIDNFKYIMNNILLQRKYNQNWCTQVLHYAYYTEKENIELENILKQCSPIHQEEYRLFINFTEIQKELFNKFISNRIYKDEIINTYKLISFQQIINDDITNKIINIDRINWYFSFLQELLKRDNIWLFYKELTYYFNNYHLKKAIENVEITSKIANKIEIDNISKQIMWFNNWNQLIWYTWLTEQVNKNLIEKETFISPKEEKEENYEQKIENLLKQIQDIDIKQKYLSGSDILINWIRKIIKKENIKKENLDTIDITTKLRLEENKNTLLVKQISFEWFDEISDAINKIIETKNWWYWDLKKYVDQNKFLFTATNETNEEEIESVCRNLSQVLVDQEIKVCNKNRVDIDLLRKNKIITMKVSHNNFLLNKIDISDDNAKALLNKYLSNPNIINKMNYEKITKIDFVEFMQKTISEFIQFLPKEDWTTEWSSNTMIIMERIKTYLWVQVNDIVEKNEKVLLDFTITWIPFLWYYNIKDNKISPIYFKEANKAKTPIIIKNFSLTLTDENKATLNIFISQPLELIKQYSPEDYILYQKFLSENK